MTVSETQGRPAHSVGVIVAVCAGIAALEGYDIQAVGVSAPSMAPALHMPEAFIGYASSISMAGLIAGAIVGGWVADRIGRRPVLAFSVAWFGVFSIATAMVQTPDMLLILRLLTGLGFGGAMPNMIAVASEVSRPGQRSATVTTVFAGYPAGGAAASLITLAVLTGWLPQRFDWRMVYLIGGVVPLFLAPLVLWVLPETRPAPHGARPNAVRVLFGEGRAMSTVFLCIAFCFTLIVIYLLVGWLPTLVVGEGLSRIDGTCAALSFNVFSTFGGAALGFLVDRFGLRRPMIGSYLGLIVSLAGLALGRGLPEIVIFSGLAGFFILGAQFSLYAVSPIYYPPSARALGVGVAVGAGRIGSIIGPSLASALRSAHASSPAVIGVTLPVILIGGAAAFVLSRVGKPYPE